MPEPDAVVLEARLLGPSSLRALRSLRLERPRVMLVFVAAPDDRVSRVIAAHLGGRVAARPVQLDEVCAAASEAAAQRASDPAHHDDGPPSGVRHNGTTPDRGKARS
jgi:DNA-binding response OmpR family regulator